MEVGFALWVEDLKSSWVDKLHVGMTRFQRHMAAYGSMTVSIFVFSGIPGKTVRPCLP